MFALLPFLTVLHISCTFAVAGKLQPISCPLVHLNDLSMFHRPAGKVLPGDGGQSGVKYLYHLKIGAPCAYSVTDESRTTKSKRFMARLSNLIVMLA